MVPHSNVGASLLAIAVGQFASVLDAQSSSRASSLPQGSGGEPEPRLQRRTLVGAGLLAMAAPSILLDDIVLELILDVFDLSPAMGRGQTVFPKIDENHLLHGQNALAGDFVAHLAGQGDGRTTKLGGGYPQLDDVALARSTDEIDFRDVLGDHALVAELDDGVDRRLLVCLLYTSPSPRDS